MSTPPVTLMVSRRAAHGRYQDLLAWLHEGEQLATDFPGYLGSGILAPPRDGDEFQIIFRFSDEPTLHAWEHSASRRAWLQRGNGLFERPKEARVSGIDDWFGTNTVQKPPRWKQAVAIWLAFFPVSLAFNLLLGPWLIILGLLWTGWIKLPLPALGFKAKRVAQNRYEVQNQWGGNDAPWHPGGEWVIGGRDNQSVVALNVKSNDGGKSLDGTNTYDNEGPIGFRSHLE